MTERDELAAAVDAVLEPFAARTVSVEPLFLVRVIEVFAQFDEGVAFLEENKQAILEALGFENDPRFRR